MVFSAYHWDVSKLTDERLRAAVRVLMSPLSAAAEFREAVLTLLHSGDTAARGIAFDHYSYARTEYGRSRAEIFDDLEDDLLAVAREELHRVPVTERVNGVSIVGANHASALHVIWRAGTAEDIERVIDFIERSQDPAVLSAACLAARYVLPEVKEPNERLLRAIRAVLARENVSDALKCEAVDVLSGYRDPDAERLLESIATEQPYPMSGHAVLALFFRDQERYRRLAEEVSRRWPAEVTFPGMYVRQLLAERAQQ
jgi:hypothetical protein